MAVRSISSGSFAEVEAMYFDRYYGYQRKFVEFVSSDGIYLRPRSRHL
ncbi:MAG: hypothetical protein GY750_04225 [Lentisphaerae bacterium]|nr:hypothetical protein [Lentisphaerota bacterium]MCP4100618.1 hypothetical protein [Lentisphaerota bacterium]